MNKRLNLCIAGIVLIFYFSCKKEDCTPKALNENIVGTWTIKHGIITATLSTGTGTFNSNGTFSTVPIDFIIDASIFSVLTYTVTSNSLTFIGTDLSGTSTYAEVVTLKSNECNKIVFDDPLLTGATYTLTK